MIMKQILLFLIMGLSLSLVSCKKSAKQIAEERKAELLQQEEEERAKFQEMFTIENFINLLDNPRDKSAAQKCGLEFVYEDSTNDEIDSYEIAFGYDVEKGNKKRDLGYEIVASSQHAFFFKYVEDSDIGWFVKFKSKDDADYLLNLAKKNGFKKKDYCYSNGNWEISIDEDNKSNGWYFLSFYPDYSNSYGGVDDNYEKGNASESYNEQREGETKQKTLQYMSELQNIANEIDNVYNQYVRLVSSGNLDPMSHGNLEIKATQNISRLKSQAESIWNKLIALARESGGDVRALQEEKQKYMSDAARMQMAIHSVGMNTGY